MTANDLPPAEDLPAPELSVTLWDDHADWWQREFTDGVDPEYTEQIVPLVVDGLAGADRVLDVGTGEGQLARALAAAANGPRARVVIGADPIAAQIAEATRRGGPINYLRSGADGLPFADASFDAVLACLVFEHIDAVDEAIAEVARVLKPGGRFLFLLNHPLLQTPGSGWIDDQLIDPPEQYWRVGPYLTEAATVEEVQKGVFIRFIHRPLSRYINALAAAGLPVARMDEPSPPPGFLAQAPWYAEAGAIPRLLALHCRRAPDGALDGLSER